MSKHASLYKTESMVEGKVGQWLIHLLHDCVKGSMDKVAIEKRIYKYLSGFDSKNRKYVVRRMNAGVAMLSDGLLDLAEILKHVELK